MKITRGIKLMFWLWKIRLLLIHNRRIRNQIKRWFDLYDPEDLQAGGHCGICGKWIENEIMPIEWAWSICGECMKAGPEERLEHLRGLKVDTKLRVTWWYGIFRYPEWRGAARVGILTSGTVVWAWGAGYPERTQFTDLPEGEIEYTKTDGKSGYSLYRNFKTFQRTWTNVVAYVEAFKK